MKEYFRVLIPMLLAFAAYQGLAVPFLEPVVTKKAPQWDPYTKVAAPEWWGDEFEPDSWQAQSSKVLKSLDSVLLFQNIEQTASDQLKLWPLTILIRRKDAQGHGRVTRIECPRGADIQFTESIDISVAVPPPIAGGSLRGEVTIVGAPSEVGGNDQMFIRTRDLFIDRRVIRTTGDVQIRLGDSYFDGRDLSIFMDQDLLGTQPVTTYSESPFEGLDRLELAVVDRMHVDLPKGGLWSPTSAEEESEKIAADVSLTRIQQASYSPDSKKVTEKLPATMDVTCQGSLQFDFHTSIATLAGGVNIAHQVVNQTADTFRADLLRMHFLWDSVAESQGVENDGWSISRIEADGSNSYEREDSSRWVMVDAPGLNARGQARQLRLDLRHGTVYLSNRLPNQIDAETIPVYLKREKMEVWSSELLYSSLEILRQAAPRNPNALPVSTDHSKPALGELDALGPGRVHLQSENDLWKLSWANRLRLTPENGEDKLTIDGGAQASSVNRGKFMAQSLTMWLRPVSEELAQQMRTLNPKRKTPDSLPTRMHAVGEVLIDSPKLLAKVDDMQVWFVYPLLEHTEVQANSNGSLELNSSSGQNASQTISPATRDQVAAVARGQQPVDPLNSIANLQVEPLADSKSVSQSVTTADNPYAIRRVDGARTGLTGRTLQAKLVYAMDETIIDDLIVNDTVTLTRDAISKEASIPLTITGDFLRMNTSDAGNADVQILGKPAMIRVGAGMIVGPEVRFDQRKQLAWINHPGYLVVPPELLRKPENTQKDESNLQVLNSQSPKKPGKREVEWINLPRIDWQGSMTFDGSIARLSEGVHLEARLKPDPKSIMHIEGSSDGMELHFAERIAMDANSSQSSKPSMLVLDQSVDLRIATTDLANNRKAISQLVVPRLDIDLQSNELYGHGPGWVRSRHRKKRDGQLECLHLAFVGSLHGFFDQREVQFQRSVEVLVGPISTWEDTLDVREMRGLSLGQSLVTCEALRMYSTEEIAWGQNQSFNDPNSPTSDEWELEALGDVRVDSENAKGTVEMHAARVIYISLQELMKIEGVPNMPAIMKVIPRNRPELKESVMRVLSAIIDLDSMEPREVKLAELSFGLNPDANESPNDSSQPRAGWPQSSGSSSPIPSPREPRRP